MDRVVERQFVDAEKGAAALAQIFDRQSEHRSKHQHRGDHDIAMSVHPCIFTVEEQRIELERRQREQIVVRLLDRATPMMVEYLTHGEIIERMTPLAYREVLPLARCSAHALLP